MGEKRCLSTTYLSKYIIGLLPPVEHKLGHYYHQKSSRMGKADVNKHKTAIAASAGVSPPSLRVFRLLLCFLLPLDEARSLEIPGLEDTFFDSRWDRILISRVHTGASELFSA